LGGLGAGTGMGAAAAEAGWAAAQAGLAGVARGWAAVVGMGVEMGSVAAGSSLWAADDVSSSAALVPHTCCNRQPQRCWGEASPQQPIHSTQRRANHAKTSKEAAASWWCRGGLQLVRQQRRSAARMQALPQAAAQGAPAACP
jgi:hypothetical protein